MHNFNRTLPQNPDTNENFMRPYFIWRQCADDAILQRFMEVGEATMQEDAKIGGEGKADLVESARISKISWLHHNEQSKDIFDWLIDKIDRVNYWNYGLALTGMESIQYTRYPINGHYKYHNDFIARKENVVRKMSIVLSITDETEYKGGDFLIAPHGDNPERLRFRKGDLIAFPSWVPHKVEPVTEGTRITAVTWVYGPKPV